MDSQFSAATRRAHLAAFASETVDLLVIGGGVTGAGVARDAAMRGIRTALVDAGDYGRGASSHSSRLIHGGLRYLEHGWFRLVFEASHERRVLLRIAPHLVRACPFTFPVHRGSRVRRWQIWAAVWLYDALALFRNADAHRLLGRRGVLRLEPLIRDQDLTGGALYWDAQCDDARLVLATIRSAHLHGARCVNYVRVVALEKAGGRVRGAELEDALTGARLVLRAHTVVNATGPWSDQLRRLDEPAAKPLLRPTKGAHIAVPRQRVGNAGAVTLLSPIDGRVMFVLPAGETTIVGTTDTDYAGSLEDVDAQEADITYLLRSANAVFPGARLQRGDVIAAWAGLRPLLADGAADASAVPREHRLLESAAGLITIAGGKLTTYRVMAAQTVDLVARRLRKLDGRRLPSHAPTDVEPLPGGDVADLAALARELEKEGMSAGSAVHLVGTYGGEAAAVANLASTEPDLARPLLPERPWLAAEVVHHARREMAMTVADVLRRRLRLFHTDPAHGLDAAPTVARLLARELRWSADQTTSAVAAYRAEVSRPPA